MAVVLTYLHFSYCQRWGGVHHFGEKALRNNGGCEGVKQWPLRGRPIFVNPYLVFLPFFVVIFYSSFGRTISVRILGIKRLLSNASILGPLLQSLCWKNHLHSRKHWRTTSLWNTLTSPIYWILRDTNMFSRAEISLSNSRGKYHGFRELSQEIHPTPFPSLTASAWFWGFLKSNNFPSWCSTSSQR